MKHCLNRFTRLAVAITAAFISSTATRGDAVTVWNANWEESVFTTAQPIPAHARFAAILHVAVYDAVNGIAHKYTPYYVTENAPPGARQEAAAVQAAYTVLSDLYPTTQTALDAHLAASIAAIPGSEGKSESIARGRAWGDYVAKKILASAPTTDGPRRRLHFSAASTLANGALFPTELCPPFSLKIRFSIPSQ